MNSSLNHDDVTNPAHYDLFPGQQAIDVIQAALTPEEFRGYLKGNALKYRLRAGEKGDPAKCLAKASWYRDRLWSLARPSTPQPVMGYTGCLVCGAYTDHGGLPCPRMRAAASSAEELRIDIVGANGNGGEHYTELAQ
jgi:hypothetical protein